MKAPDFFAGAHIKGPDIARCARLALGVDNRDDYGVLKQRQRRRAAVVQPGEIPLIAITQLDNAVFPNEK